jgi:hypothetical protein
MPGWLGLSSSDEVLNFLYRGTPISIGGTLYMRLLVAPSSRSGGGTETTFGGYARKPFPRDGTMFTSASSGVGRLANGIILDFGTPGTAGNGQLVWLDFVDTSAGVFTKLYHGGQISPARTVVVGQPVRFSVGSLVLTI